MATDTLAINIETTELDAKFVGTETIAEKGGANEYLTKPIQANRVLAVAKSLLKIE